jgi:AAA family ATP:ADP antiporter
VTERWIPQSVTKFLLFGVLYFLLAFSAVIFRDLKDVLIVTAPGGGALLAANLKDLVLPAQVALFAAFMILYRRDYLPQLMFFTVLVFLLFFMSFHFWMQSWGLWIYKVYYVMGEVWGTVAIGLFFWALANQTFETKEAQWAYPLFILFGEVSTLLWRGHISLLGQKVFLSAGYILLGVMAVFLLWSWVLKKHLLPLPSEVNEQKTVAETTMSFRGAYLGLILAIVVAFGFCQQVSQFAWKPSIMILYPTAEEYASFMGQLSYYMGFGGFFLFLLTFWMIRAFGGMPLMVFFMVLVAVLCQRVPAIATSIESAFHLTPGSAPFWALVAQQAILTGIAGTLFVATKEMAYIPLSITTKARGKAFIDLFCGRIGVSLGHVALTAALMVDFQLKDQLSKEIPLALLLMVLGAAFLWILAVCFLGKLYKRIAPL